MRPLILAAVVLLCALAGMLLLLCAIALVRRAQPDERAHMDAVPPVLRPVWPLVAVLQFHLRATMPTASLVRRRRQLQRAGLEFVLKAEEFIAVQAIAMAACGLAGLWTSGLLGATPGSRLLATLGGCVAGWRLPLAWLRDRRLRREREILRTLPGYLDMITLCCQAGLSLGGALAQAVLKGPGGALGLELDRALREMRTGASRASALAAMADRLDIRHVTTLVSGLTQAESLGASLADTLAAIAEQRRTERFQQAEKLAMEAPVKMIGPLVVFIFPVTFIVIFFPLAMEFLASTR